MTHIELAEDAIDTDFNRVIEWVDPEALTALVKAIHQANERKDTNSVLLFCNSLSKEINIAALNFTAQEFNDMRAKITSTSWANRLEAMHEVGHSNKDFM